MFRQQHWNEKEHFSSLESVEDENQNHRLISERTPTKLKRDGNQSETILSTGEHQFVKPIKIVGTIQSPKVLKPIPVAHRVSVMFDETTLVDETSALFRRGGIRQPVLNPIASMTNPKDTEPTHSEQLDSGTVPTTELDRTCTEALFGGSKHPRKEKIQALSTEISQSLSSDEALERRLAKNLEIRNELDSIRARNGLTGTRPKGNNILISHQSQDEPFTGCSSFQSHNPALLGNSSVDLVEDTFKEHLPLVLSNENNASRVTCGSFQSSDYNAEKKGLGSESVSKATVLQSTELSRGNEPPGLSVLLKHSSSNGLQIGVDTCESPSFSRMKVLGDHERCIHASSSGSSFTTSETNAPGTCEGMTSFPSTRSSESRRNSLQTAPSSSSSLLSDTESSSSLDLDQNHLGRKQKKKDRKPSRKMFDRRKKSKTDEKKAENPWFQSNSDALNAENSTFDSSLKTGLDKKAEKGSRKKLGKLGRAMKNQRKKQIDEHLSEEGIRKSAEASAHSPVSALISGGSSIQHDTKSPTAADNINVQLSSVIRKALSGKRSMEHVLECMVRVYNRPEEETLKLLFKYLSSNSAVVSSLKWITEEIRIYQDEIPMDNRTEEKENFIILSRIYREVLLNTLATGPSSVKKAFLQNNKAREAVCSFLTGDRPEERLELKSWIKASASVLRLLNSIILDHSTEVASFMSSRPNLLHSIVKSHVNLPEAVSFVSQLCVADALSQSADFDLRYGSANPSGILLLGQENVTQLLVQVFMDSCSKTSQSECIDIYIERQSKSLECLKELSLRAIAVPKFGKNNCSFSRKHIKMLNTALEATGLYSSPTYVHSIMESAIAAIDSTSTKSITECNNPLICTLSLLTELMDAVIQASESNNIAIRRTAGKTDLGIIRNVFLSRMEYLFQVMRKKSGSRITQTARVQIIRWFRSLFAYNDLSGWNSSPMCRVPEELLRVLEENESSSMIHKAVLACLQASMKRKDAIVLQGLWLKALGNHKEWRQEMRCMVEGRELIEDIFMRQRRMSIRCVYLDMAFALLEATDPGHKRDLNSMFESVGVSLEFLDQLEATLVKIRNENETPCGGPKPEAHTISVLACVESLTARLDDVNAV